MSVLLQRTGRGRIAPDKTAPQYALKVAYNVLRELVESGAHPNPDYVFTALEDVMESLVASGDMERVHVVETWQVVAGVEGEFRRRGVRTPRPLKGEGGSS